MPEKLFSFPQAQAADLPNEDNSRQLISFAEIPPDTKFTTVPNTPYPSVSFTDLDGDGDLDMVVTNPAPGQPKWVENTLGSQANTIFQHNIFERISPTTMAVGDLDGDGTDDVVIGHMSGAKIFYNHGGWVMEDLGAVLNVPRTILLDDVNQDGNTDILVRDSQDLILFQSLEGQLGIQNMTWPDLGDSNLLAVGNFNLMTPASEIVVYKAQTQTLGIVAHTGSNWACFQSITSLSATKVVITDTNDDGLDDIYVEDNAGHAVVLESDGSGELKLNEAVSTVTSAPMTVTAPAPSEDDDFVCDEDAQMAPPPQDDPSPMYDSVAPPPAPEPMPALMPELITSRSFMMVEVEPETMVEVSGSSFSDILFCEDESEEISTFSGNDIVFAGGGNDILHAGKGHDIAWGGAGDDTLNGNRGNDVLFGESGDDSIHGGHNDDLLFGGAGEDTLNGCRDDDIVFGGSGNDLLIGGTGADILFGESGADTFHYGSTKDGGDYIADFEHGRDVLEFDFGSHRLLNKADLTDDMKGDAFIWDTDTDWGGNLYYDPNLTVKGDEYHIAEIDTDADITLDDIDIV